MALEPRQAFQRPPKVTMPTFLGVAWGGTGVSLIFVIGRLYTRIHVHRRLYWDDFLVIFAWVLLLVNTAIWQKAAKHLYSMMNVEAGLAPFTSTFPDDVHLYLIHSIPVIAFFYTGLWAIKLSFLVFFRRLGSMVRGQRIHWWIVFVLTVTTWIITFGTIQYDCLTGDLPYLIQYCAVGYAVRFQRMTLLYNMAMDVITDAAILTIPIHLLWNVRINLKQKLLLMGIFSLTVVIIIFAIVRASVITTYSNQPDATWLYLWSSIEQAVSILIACLASFRSLFVKQDPSQRKGRLGIGSGTNDSWSWHLLVSKASRIFPSSRYLQTSDSNSLPRPNMSSFKTNHSNISTSKHDAVTGKTIQVGHETTIISYPREESEGSRSEARDW